MKVITIGRDVSNDVVITNDPHASRHHLQIIQHDDGHFTLMDFGSTNGTSVNGNRIRGEVSLNEMDIVRVGNTTIPWRDYFYPDENEPLSENTTQNFDDDTPSISSSVITKEIEPKVPNGWLLSISILALLSGTATILKDILLFCDLYFSEYPFWLLEGISIIGALALIVLSIVFIVKKSRK